MRVWDVDYNDHDLPKNSSEKIMNFLASLIRRQCQTVNCNIFSTQEVKRLVGDKGYNNQVATFAKTAEATLSDLKAKNQKKDLVGSGKAFKILKSLLCKEFLNWINYGLFKLTSNIDTESRD